MKTRRFATKVDSGRVDESRLQACGLVSRMMVSRDGASAVSATSSCDDASTAFMTDERSDHVLVDKGERWDNQRCMTWSWFHVQASMNSVTANPPLPIFNLVANHQTDDYQHESIKEEHGHYYGCSKTPSSRIRCASIDITSRISFPSSSTPTLKAIDTIVASKYCSGQLSRLW